MTETTEMFATITVTQDIPEQRVRDLMCSAWEGGSTYWCGLKQIKMTPEAKVLIEQIKAERAKVTEDLYRHEYPFYPGVELVLYDVGEDDDAETWILNREKLIEGLQVMATKYPRHWNNFVSENDDAETGDVYLQCCLFGEIVYG